MFTGVSGEGMTAEVHLQLLTFHSIDLEVVLAPVYKVLISLLYWDEADDGRVIRELLQMTFRLIMYNSEGEKRNKFLRASWGGLLTDDDCLTLTGLQIQWQLGG